MSGGANNNRLKIGCATVAIMDFSNNYLMVSNYEGSASDLTTQLTLDGKPVGSLLLVISFYISTVQLVQA